MKAWHRRDRTARRAEASRPGLLITALLSCALAAGCVPPSTKGGVPGEQDVALFDAATKLAFEARLTVGSQLEVSVVGRRGDDEARVLAGSFASSDDEVLRVRSSRVEEEGEGDDAFERHRVELELTGPGEAYLVLLGDDGALVDRVLLKAAVPERVELLDGTLLGGAVDARLPDSFALVDNHDVSFVVAATDQCGGAMLDLGGVEVQALARVPSGEEPSRSPYVNAVVQEAGVWALQGTLPDDDPLTPRQVDLTLVADGVAQPVVYGLKVVPASAVDEVDVAVARAEPGVATLWGRAFADDVEVIGLSYDWESNARVSLNVDDAPVAIASISFPAEGEPADERPALVSAEVFGTEDELDLLSLRDERALRPGRVPPADEAPPPVGPSCGGEQATCDPYQLGFVITALLLGRRLKRKQRP